MQYNVATKGIVLSSSKHDSYNWQHQCGSSYISALQCLRAFSSLPFPVSKQTYATQLSQGRFPRGQAALVQVSQTSTLTSSSGLRQS